jgi:two-component system, NarL family, response regulator NreC
MNERMIRIFIVEDHETYLEGLALLLAKQGDIQITGTASTGQDLLSQLPEIQADILLLDVHLPDMDEEELLKKVRAIRPSQKIIYLTLMRGTRFVHKLIRHGIQGYVLKNSSISELTQAIRTVQDGESWYSKEIDILSDHDFRQTLTLDDGKVDEILSRREIEVLVLVCKEYSNAEIAEKLFLSISTVETHRKNLIAKLGVNNTVGLVKFALKNHLID